MATPHIQVILAADQVPELLHAALQRTPATASFWSLSEALRATGTSVADAVVLVVPEDPTPIAGRLRVLFDRLAERPRATLVLTGSGRPAPSLAHPPTVPVTFGGAPDEHDLSVRLGTMLDMRASLDSLHHGLLANRRSGESLARRYARQLRLASQVQRELLPEAPPRLGRVSFATVFCPVDYVSGDIYDVHRLDEDHVGIAVADATGHGIPAALLTVYIKRALRGKEIENGSYRILAPDEVLARLNEDLLDAHLTDCPFVAVVYAVLNVRTSEVVLARGGAPFPLVRRGDGALDVVTPRGGVVGVLPDAEFELARLQLGPGDALLLYTDGLERIVAPEHRLRAAPEMLRQRTRRLRAYDHVVDAAAGTTDLDVRVAGSPATAVAEPVSGRAEVCHRARVGLTARQRRLQADGAPAHDLVTNAGWCRVLQARGTAAALEQVRVRQRALRRIGCPLDDLTVLAVQVDA